MRRTGLAKGRSRRFGPALIALVLLLQGCGENLFAPPNFNIVFVGPDRRQGSSISLQGQERYRCENVAFQIRGVSSRPGTSAEWISGRLELFSLRTGERLGVTPLNKAATVEFWGFDRVEAGETRSSEAFDFRSDAPFVLRAAFQYKVPRRVEETFRLEMVCE
jgi:hypothetical protein